MNKIVTLGIIAVVFAGMIYFASPVSSTEMDTTKLHNRGNLAFKSIPANDYLHLFDATPDTIAGGHLALKVNCDEEGNGKVDVLMGVAPEANVIKLNDENRIDELSSMGKMCLYHVDLPPEDMPDLKVTDIALSNPTDERMRFGATASYTIYVNGWGEPIEEHHE